MRGAERVVFAFGALGEAGEPALGAQRADAVAAACQDLVRIGLVADVPDQAVVRRVEDMVQRDGQFDDAEAGAEMAARDGHGVDEFGAQFGGASLGTKRYIWWNFVSSSKERIEQAKEEWKTGRFDIVPGDDKEFIPLPEN